MQAAQDITIGGPPLKNAVSVYARRSRPRRAQPLGRAVPRQDEVDPGHHRRRHRPAERRTAARHHYQSRSRLELRHPAVRRSTIRSSDAFGQRIVSTMLTQQNQYHVVLEVQPQVPVRTERHERYLRQLIERAAGAAITLVDSAVKVAPLVVNHQGQFPSMTISFNLLPGTAIGSAVDAIQQAGKATGQAGCRCRPASRAMRRRSSRRCRARRY